MRMVSRFLVVLWVCCSPAAPAQDRPSDGAGLRVGPQIRVGDDLPALPQVEPVVAVNPRDPANIVVASLVVQDPLSDRFWESWTVQALVSSDGGATWRRHRLPGLENAFAGDPWLSWAPDGAVYLSCLLRVDQGQRSTPLKVWLYKSTDGGRGWSSPVEVPFAGAGSLDHPVLDISDGQLYVFASRGLSSIVVARAGMPPEVLEPLPAFGPDTLNNNLGSGTGLPDGQFLFSYFSMSVPQPSPLWAIRSTDGGRTYQRSLITPEHIPVGFPSMRLNRASGVHAGRVYAVWVRSDAQPYVMLGHSDDLGASWSHPVRVHADSSTVTRAVPAVSVDRSGLVAVAWIDGRHHQGDCWDVYATASRDGGATFVPEHRLTPETSCPGTSANGGAGRRWRWGGDYIAIAPANGGAFYVVWSDSRSGVYQLWMRRIEIDEPK